ncbi:MULTISPECIES: phenylacetate--CoA ligase family protein [unclassified Psychrobacter]|uniref:phenylacetate--CoA ligase family protein n=1 Tax=unclassified Psychrobacter TaxID=196806 RepID=UPI00071E9654|nr:MULTISPECIES: AMP-binding protein [unclassified Psychrobacter]OLF38979.1 phenylacetate--CoA ligase [Psychrobacter sp. Cmf 22.2]
MSLEFYNRIEVASRDEISALQLKRLKHTVKHAFENNTFWKNRLASADVHPDDIKSLEDISKIPFMVKNDFRDNYPLNLLCAERREVVRLHGSSGTTGKPTIVAYTRNDIEMWAEAVARSLAIAGVTSDDTVQVAYGYGLFTGGMGAHYGAERLGAMVIPISGGMTNRQIQIIEELRPEAMMVTPSYMVNIAEAMEKMGQDPRKTSLRVGIFGAEPWTNEMRRHIEERFNMDALDIYGLSEVVGPGVAQEAVASKGGLTFWEDLFYPEIIDPETGEVLPDGEQGELVITTLMKEAMPVLRYRTGDITRILPGDVRSMRRIEKITARNDDMIILRGVNIYPSLLEEQIMKVPGLSSNYLIERYRVGAMDQLRIRVEPVDENQSSSRLKKELIYNVKSTIGASVEVIIEPIGVLPRSEGKAKRVMDLRQHA